MNKLNDDSKTLLEFYNNIKNKLIFPKSTNISKKYINFQKNIFYDLNKIDTFLIKKLQINKLLETKTYYNFNNRYYSNLKTEIYENHLILSDKQR